MARGKEIKDDHLPFKIKKILISPMDFPIFRQKSIFVRERRLKILILFLFS